jgi:hypothetical protein
MLLVITRDLLLDLAVLQAIHEWCIQNERPAAALLLLLCNRAAQSSPGQRESNTES